MIPLRCWCGHIELLSFSPEYSRCPACETLITSQTPAQAVPQVADDERDFYGRQYWFAHQERDMGLTNVLRRARTDLPERSLHWLRTVLKYRLPPGSILELGSAHGGFVAMLNWAGFNATGLELGPWIVDYARQTFGVPMLLGPIEEQGIEPGSLDAIALMDVLEHLPDPVSTMRHCLNLLKPDGILIIQTPRYAESKTYEAMLAEGDPFLAQLKTSEHLYLFSPSSISKLFHRLGADYLAFEPAIFAQYDMFLIASRAPLIVCSSAEIESALAATPNGRMLQAMLDLDDQKQHMQTRLAESEADRAARLEQIHELTGLLHESQADRAARLDNIHNLEKLLAEAEADRAARLDNIHALEKLLAESEADRAARLDNIHALEKLLVESEADRAAQLKHVRNLEKRLAESEADRAAQLKIVERQETAISGLQSQVANVKAAYGLLQTRNIEMQRQIESLKSEQGKLAAQIDYWSSLVDALRPALQDLRTSRVYWLMRKLGRWDWLEQSLSLFLPPGTSNDGSKHRRVAISQPQVKLKRVAVDLTPVLPGGENGGAKVVAVELVRNLAQLDPDIKWVLLTADKSHDELAFLDAHNVRRLCVVQQKEPVSAQRVLKARLKTWLRDVLAAILPASAMTRLKSLYRRVASRPRPSSLLREIGADLVFCPFTAPLFFDPAVPMVVVAYDLQYLYYPQFFTADERYYRDLHFKESCRLATRLICISDYVRGTVLENAQIDPDRVLTIPICLFNRLPAASGSRATVLEQLQLERGRYLVYPANFWPHKNHEMLFTAWGIYASRHPQSDLKLVCTGAPGARMERLQDIVARMGLGKQIIFAGFMPDDEFAVLLQSCRAVIFPSLYEGFGMPVLEAMAWDKPVLCSNVTSLPEVAGNAALLFDPRKPAEIVQAIERVESDQGWVEQSIRRGRERLAAWGGPVDMAGQYLQIFHQALCGEYHWTTSMHGVYSDGWTGRHLTIVYGDLEEERFVELTLSIPAWLPFKDISVQMIHDRRSKAYTIRRGSTLIIRHALPRQSGSIEFEIAPTFQPQAYEMNDDKRMLGCMCQKCRIISPSQVIDLLSERAGQQ